MIKELNYYLTTNRFSKITEEIMGSVNDYAHSFNGTTEGNAELREKARIICENQMKKSGLSDKNTFINIDYEFFENGELKEERLNRFVKEILKAHGYQKILWEYMGTTGLMTNISKDAMKHDGFNYENFLPSSLKQAEFQKRKNSICRDFNRLKDESGFNWSQGYDPNYTVEKYGWTGGYDQDNVWKYYKTSELTEVSEKQNLVYKIQLVKTEHGCMLFDSKNILLNPVILWYLNSNHQVYGAKSSNVKEILNNIKVQMKTLGVSKITEIAGNDNEKNLEEYKKILGSLAHSNVQMISVQKAHKQITDDKNVEKLNILENATDILQKKIETISKNTNGLSFTEILAGIESDRININVDIESKNDAALLNISDEEFALLKKYIASLEGKNKDDYKKAVTVFAASYTKYKGSVKTKTEMFEAIYKYLKHKTPYVFEYEKTLASILSEELDFRLKNETLQETAKLKLPSENLETAINYINSIPEQRIEIKAKVEKSLKNAIANYLEIRSSTGMNIKELFDFAIKSNGGRLPKASFEPPVVGYITPGQQKKIDEGERPVYFEQPVENFIAELITSEYPTKEVSVSELIKQSKKSRSKTIKLSTKNPNQNKMIYSIGNTDNVSFIAELLKTKLKGKKYNNLTGEELLECARIVEVFEKEKLKALNNQSSLIKDIEPVFRQTEVSKEVEIPENLTIAEPKQRFGIENVKVFETRMNRLGLFDFMNKGTDFYKETAQLLKTLTPNQQKELMQYAGNNANAITPLFINEYLHKKHNGLRTKGISNAEEIAITDWNNTNMPIGISSIDNTDNLITDQTSVVTIPSAKNEHIKIEPPSGMTEGIQESLKNLAEKRKSETSPEMTKIERMNASYEHDRSILTKTDPAFMARNQFWDIGHAEGSGIEIDRNIMNKIVSNEITLLKNDLIRREE